MVVLWPDGTAASLGTPSDEQVTGVVESVDPQACPDAEAVEDCGTAAVR